MARVTRALPPADYPGCPVTVTDALAEGRDLRTPRWGLWDILWSLAIGFVVGAIAVIALGALNAPTSVQILVGVAAQWVGLAGWPLIATAWRGNGPRIDLGLRLTWSDTGWGLLFGFAALILAGISAALTQLIVPDLNSAAGEAAELLQDSGRTAIVMFALVVLIGAPVVEELFFRGLLFAALRKRGLGAVWTIVVTGVAFAGFHLEPTRFLILLPTGLLLGVVRWKTGSTGAAMVAHGCVNAPGAILMLLGVDLVTP